MANLLQKSKHFLFILVLILVSCSPQRRLNNIIKRNPGLLQQTDTITVRDTVRFTVPAVSVDTVISLSQARDTFYFQKEFVHVKTYIKGDSIYIEAKTDQIEKIIYREIKVPVKKFVAQKAPIPQWFYLLMILFSVVFLCLFAWRNHKKDQSEMQKFIKD